METIRATANPKTSSSQPKVSFLNLAKLFHDHKEEFLEAMTRVMDNAAFIGGEEVNRFEAKFAEWILSGSHGIGCGNGTDAITLATEALDLPEGSEAIVPAMTYIATAAGIQQGGVKVRLVDVTPDTYLIDTKALEKAITSKTKLIAPVHLYGQMAPMDEIRKIADKHGCKVLEDAAQAHGAKWKNHSVGHWGDVATFSFYPGKNLGAFGDAGAVVTRHKEIALAAKALGHQGGLKKYEHLRVAYNSRLDNLQAAVLNVKLKYIDGWNDARRNVAKIYKETLSGISGLQLPVEHADSKHVYHIYAVQVENREDFGAYLKDRGIETGVHYPKAIHQLPAFAKSEFAKESFPVAEKLAKHGISLPMCPTLKNEEAYRVAEAVKSYFKK